MSFLKGPGFVHDLSGASTASVQAALAAATTEQAADMRESLQIGDRSLTPSGALDPLNFTAHLQSITRPFGPENPAVVEWRAPLESNIIADTGYESNSGGGDVTLAGGVLTFVTGASAIGTLVANHRLTLPFATVIVSVDSRPNASIVINTGFNAAAVSTTAGATTFGAYYSVSLTASPGGTWTAEIYDGSTRNSVAVASVPARFELALSLTGENLSTWIRDMTGIQPGPWVFLTGYRISGLRAESVFNRLYPHVSCVGAGGNVLVSGIRVSEPMGVGLANPNACTFEDGSPFIKDGRVYFLANSPTFLHTSSEGFGVQASQCGIWSWSPSDNSLRRESLLFFRRSGSIYGDNAGHAVFDREAGEWLLLIPNWGNYTGSGSTAFTYLYRTTANILAGRHVLEGSQMTLPTATPGYSHWDPALYKVGATWYLTYAEATDAVAPWGFKPRLASSSDLSTWTHVASYTPSSGNIEGFKPCLVGGNLVISACTTASATVLFFDPTTLTLDGTISITGLDNTAPAEHFQIVGVPEGGITEYYGLGMSKQMWRSILYSWGALKVWKIHQTRTGWETSQARFDP